MIIIIVDESSGVSVEANKSGKSKIKLANGETKRSSSSIWT